MISARELAESFTPAPGEVEWARGRTQNDQHFLALVVRLKCYQRLGYFPKLAEVPVMVVDHVRGKLELARDVAAVADAERTGKRHRQFVRDRLGVKYAPAAVREVAATAIRTAVQCKDNPADLINVALDELVRQRCELPGYTTLDAMAASIRVEVNSGMFATVAARLGRADRERLERLLLVDPVRRRSEFDRLKDPAQAATVSKLEKRLAHLAALDALGPTEVWMAGLPPGKIAHFAGEARVTDAADMRKVLADDKRLTLVDLPGARVPDRGAGRCGDHVLQADGRYRIRRAGIGWRSCASSTGPSPSGCWGCSAPCWPRRARRPRPPTPTPVGMEVPAPPRT